VTPFDIARLFYLGMTKLCIQRRELLYMTPREYFALWGAYVAYNNLKPKTGGATIDALP